MQLRCISSFNVFEILLQLSSKSRMLKLLIEFHLNEVVVFFSTVIVWPTSIRSFKIRTEVVEFQVSFVKTQFKFCEMLVHVLIIPVFRRFTIRITMNATSKLGFSVSFRAIQVLNNSARRQFSSTDSKIDIHVAQLHLSRSKVQTTKLEIQVESS